MVDHASGFVGAECLAHVVEGVVCPTCVVSVMTHPDCVVGMTVVLYLCGGMVRGGGERLIVHLAKQHPLLMHISDRLWRLLWGDCPGIQCLCGFNVTKVLPRESCLFRENHVCYRSDGEVLPKHFALLLDFPFCGVGRN